MKKTFSSYIVLKRTIAIMLLTIGTLQSIKAQINTNKIRVDLSSLSFKACSDANNGLSTVIVQSKQATTTDFQITFDFPDGVYYQAGTGIITAQTGSGDFSFSEVDITNLNQPIFRIERPSNAPWQINDQVTFTYQKTADCDAVQYSYSGGLFKDAHTINFNDHQGSQTATDNNLSVNSYNLFRAFLAVDDIPDVSDVVGGVQYRDIVIRNSGNGSVESFDHQVTVNVDLRPNYQLSFNGSVLTPVSISGGIYTYNIDLNSAPFSGQVGDGDNLFENESITLVELLSLDVCGWNKSTFHSPRWGCNPSVYCQVGTEISGSFSTIVENPDLSLERINYPTIPRWDAPTTYTNRIANDVNADIAYDVNINIGFGWYAERSTEGTNYLWGVDRHGDRQLDNFRFAGGTTFTPTRWVHSTEPWTGIGSYFLDSDVLTFDPDGPGGLEDLDGDGYFDDLAPGESTDVLFDMTMLPDTPVCDEWNKTFLHNEQLRVEVWSVNKCTNPTDTKRQDLNSSEVQVPSLFNWTDPEDYDIDAIPGEVFNLNFVGRLDGYYELPTCNGTEMFGNDASTTYRVELTVPSGVTLDASADARYSQAGNTITFLETNLADFFQDSYSLRIPIDFPLNIDCATYAGPDYMEIDFSTYYESSCFNREIHCGNFGVQTHCPDGCSGPTTTSFEANRVTAGWTDDSMSTKVVLDENIHATKYYMAKDEMVITTSAAMINDVKDNLFLELRYVTDDNGLNMSDIIAFESGTITINDLSSGSQTTAITVAPTINTFGVNDNRMTFDLSSYRSIISPTYEYGEGFEGDEIELELHFRFKDVFPEQGRLYEFYSFSGEFYSFDGGGTRTSCEVYSDRAFYFDNEVGLLSRNDFFVTGCDRNWIEVTIESSGLSDKFPDEFRPPFLLEETTIEIPQGMVFDNQASSWGYPNVQPEDEGAASWNNGLSYSVSGNVVTITPNAKFRNLDQGGNNSPNISIPVYATSATPATSNFAVSATYIDFAYADDAASVTESDTQLFSYYNKSFTITSPEPNIIGNSELASFTVHVSNGAVQEINHNWLRVDPGTGYTITGAFIDNGGTESPLNVVEEAGIYYIEYGAMEGWIDNTKIIRFEGTFNDCNLQEIKVSQNYDCISYPSSYTGLPFFHEQTFTLLPVEAAIQLDILSQPTTTVDTCTDYNVILEVRNAGEGDFINPIVEFDVPGDITGLTFTDLQIEYPRNSGNIESITPTITGNTVTIDLLQHTLINIANGISGSYGTSSLDEQIAIINMTLNPQCNYRSNTGTEYIITGNNPCGTPALGSGSRLASDPIIITGAEPPYSTNSVAISSPNLAGCDMETVSVETYIVDGTTGTNDFTRIVLPSGLIYEPGSFVSTGTVTATYVNTITVGDHEEIEIALPSGAGTTDLIAYDFGIQSTANICTGTYSIDLSTYVTVSGLTCGGVACGTTEVETGTADTQISITKGILDQSSFTATAEYVQGSPDTNYAIEIGLENTGSVDLTSGMTYEVFCADGSGVKTGSSLYSGTLAQAIPAGTTIQESFSFDSSTFCGANSNIVVEFAPGSSNCFCDVLSVVIASTASPAFGDVTFVDDNITVNEANGTAIVEVIFNGNFPGGFTLDYNTLANTAIAPDDFSITNNTLSFNGTDGEIQQITIPIIDDTLVEVTENFLVNILNPSSGIINILDPQATVNITDNDVVGISIDDASASEGDNMAFTITATQAPLTDLVFDLTYTDITTVPADYSGPTQVTLAANTTSVSFNVAALDDDWYENTQTFDLTIAVSSGSANITDDTGRGTILDTDQATVSTGNYDVLEDVGIVQLRVFLTNSGGRVGVESAFTVDVTVNSNLLSFPATDGSDYTATTATISFPANSPAGTEFFIPLTILDDAIAEPSERVIQRLSNASVSGIGLAGPGGIVRIHDNDTATVTLQDITVNEDVGTINYQFTLSGQTQDPFDISYLTADNTAITPDDYSSNSGTLNFTGTNGEIQTVSLSIVDDSIIELAEDFTVTGNYTGIAPSFTNALAQNIVFSNNPGTVTITDNDGSGAGEGISVADFTVDESVGTADFVITYTGPTVADAFTVDFSVTDGSAIDPDDYTMATVGTQVTFPAGTTDGTTQVVTVNIVDDAIIEASEDLNITLSNISNTGIAMVDADGTGNITDNDGSGAGEGISVADFTVDESVGTADFVITYTGPTVADAFTVDFSVTDGSAIDPDDYTMATVGTQVTFPAGTTDGTTQVVTVNIVDDAIIEASEDLNITLSNISNTGIAMVDADGTGNITDNDGSGAGEGISVADFTVDESVGTADFVITYTGPTVADAFTVDFSVTDGSAIDPDDYTMATVGTQVTFPAGTTDGTTQVVTVNIVDDAIIEASEDLNITLSNISNTGIAMVDADGTGNITDNDGSGAGEGISVADFTVDESVGTADFVITYTGPTVADAFTVDFSVTDGSAIDPDDYTMATVGTQVTFPAGTTDGTTQVVTVNIVDDAIIEASEDLNITLSNISNTGIAMVDADGTGNITDNDGSGAGEGISVADFTVDESVGTADFVITYTGPTVADAFTVDFSVTDGSAIDPDDYTMATVGTQVTFPAGTTDGTTQVVTVNIVDDAIIEASEDLNITLSNISNTGIAMVDADGTGNITDNDGSGAGEGISVADFTVDESAGTADFVITYTGPTVADAFTVDFSVTDGSAIDPDDYTMATVGTQVTFPAGTVDGTVQVVTVNIVDDAIIEASEDLNITLSNISNTGIAMVDADGTGNITDNDGSGAGEGISVADFTVDESVGTADFVITYTGPTVADAFTVDFSVTDGSAIDPDDYTMATVGTQVTFPAGTTDGTTQVVTVNIVDDAIIEASEDLNITLSNISNTGIAMVDADGTGNITDNDGSGAGEGISVADFTVDESAGTADFVITYTGPTVADAFTVDFSVTDGSAIDPDDYTMATVGTQVTFPAGTVDGTVQVVTVNIVDDAIIEASEDLNITLSNISNTGIAMVDADGTGNITDNDGSGAGEGISVADFTVDESVGTADFVIIYSGNTVQDTFNVNFTVTDGSAIDPDDYTMATVGTQVTFPAGTVDGTVQVVTVNIIDDMIAETTENLNITLEFVTVPPMGVNMLDGNGIGTITDNNIMPEPYEEQMTVLCGDPIPDAPTLTFTGGCGDYTVVFDQTRQDAVDSEDYMIIRTWNVTDSCGNTASFEQLIFVLQPQLQEITIDICIEDEPIDLVDYLPQGFDTNGTFTPIGADVVLNGSIFDPMQHQVETYQVEYSSIAGDCKYYVDFTIVVNRDCVPCNVDQFTVSKAVTANGDGVNDLFEIRGAEFCNNTFNVMIFNRWGNKVYEAVDYKNNWGGFAPDNSLGSSGHLPTGTYYYIIDIIGDDIQQINGYIYLGTSK